MENIDNELLLQVADLHSTPQGAFNIRKNGELLSRNTTAEIDIVSKKDKSGIDIIVKENTKNKSVHIPVIITNGGFEDVVYNDFFIENNCDITIVAGCGIHNDSNNLSSHNGIHTFYIGENCKVKYIEKHFASGSNTKKDLNPITQLYIGKNSTFEMDTFQLGGVDNAKRKTFAKLENDASLLVSEKILTTGKQKCITNFNVTLAGENSKVEVVSRAIAKDKSSQHFASNVVGKNKSFGHVECDGMLCDNASISSTPKLLAKNVDAVLIHEAAIGKISEEQQNKLMTLGLSKEEAEKIIIDGFLN